MDNYNNTKHTIILMKPKDVDKKNEGRVWTTLYGYHYEYPLPKFKVDDTVRISKYKSTFMKGYEANFTEELFKVLKVIRGDPNVYGIEDLEGEPIIGKFYVYRVETILKRKSVKGKKMVLVKYDSKHNSKIPESDIQDLG